MKNRKPLQTVDGNENWCSSYWKQYRGLVLKKLNRTIWTSNNCQVYILKWNHHLIETTTLLLSFQLYLQQPSNGINLSVHWQITRLRNSPPVTGLMNLENIMLTEISQTQKSKILYDLSCIRNLINRLNTYKQYRVVVIRIGARWEDVGQRVWSYSHVWWIHIERKLQNENYH